MTTTSAAHTFIDLWQKKDTSPKAKAKLEQILSATPLSGRISYGKKQQQGFGVYLAAEEWRRISWVFGPDAIRKFLGMSARDICLDLGFGESFLDERIAGGYEFIMVVFPSSSTDTKQATWEGAEYFLEAHYPEVWNKISAQLPQIKAMTFEELAKVAGYDMEAVNMVGRDHATGESADENYISLQRLVRRKGTLVEVRQFLWDELQFSRLYTGTGHTMNEDGGVGPPEYMVRNMKLLDIKGLVMISVVPMEENDISASFWNFIYQLSCCIRSPGAGINTTF